MKLALLHADQAIRPIVVVMKGSTRSERDNEEIAYPKYVLL